MVRNARSKPTRNQIARIQELQALLPAAEIVAIEHALHIEGKSFDELTAGQAKVYSNRLAARVRQLKYENVGELQDSLITVEMNNILRRIQRKIREANND